MAYVRIRSVVSAALVFAVLGPLSPWLRTVEAQEATPGRSRTVQQIIPTAPTGPTVLDQQQARDTREQLRQLLSRHPPALARVLALDPTLLSTPSYLTPYPAVAEFIARHPEVPRQPSYFLGFVESYGYNNDYDLSTPEQRLKRETINMWRNTMEGLTFFMAFLAAMLTVAWLIRYVVGHRRWLRATKVQSDMHSRLMERFSSNEELIAYVQSPAGSHFLKASPLTVDASNGRSLSAPFGRILWSVQAGLVLVCGGIGLLFIKRHLLEEVAQMMMAMGVIAISLGIGFALSALASYVLSQRLGLLDAAPLDGRGDSGSR